MTDLGLMHCFHGIEISQVDERFIVSQNKIHRKPSKEVQMNGKKTISPPFLTNKKLRKDDGLVKVNVSLRELYQELTFSRSYTARLNECDEYAIKTYGVQTINIMEQLGSLILARDE